MPAAKLWGFRSGSRRKLTPSPVCKLTVSVVLLVVTREQDDQRTTYRVLGVDADPALSLTLSHSLCLPLALTHLRSFSSLTLLSGPPLNNFTCASRAVFTPAAHPTGNQAVSTSSSWYPVYLPESENYLNGPSPHQPNSPLHPLPLPSSLLQPRPFRLLTVLFSFTLLLSFSCPTLVSLVSRLFRLLDPLSTFLCHHSFFSLRPLTTFTRGLRQVRTKQPFTAATF